MILLKSKDESSPFKDIETRTEYWIDFFHNPLVIREYINNVLQKDIIHELMNYPIVVQVQKLLKKSILGNLQVLMVFILKSFFKGVTRSLQSPSI